MLTLEQFEILRADINRHAEVAITDLEKRTVEEQYTARQIIDHAFEIGRRQARDLAALERDAETPTQLEQIRSLAEAAKAMIDTRPLIDAVLDVIYSNRERP